MKRALSRLRTEDGFGLLELAIAMVMLNVGILAIAAAFNSGAVSLRRASQMANAAAIADTYLERYRGYRNCQIYLTRSTITSAGSTYTSDQALSGTTAAAEIDETTVASGSNTPIPTSCTAQPPYAPASTAHTASYSGPDKRTYVVDLYVLPYHVKTSTDPNPPTFAGWQKQVTVVVRDSANPTRTLVRESSMYDPFDAP